MTPVTGAVFDALKIASTVHRGRQFGAAAANRPCESVATIRPEIRFWRAPMRRWRVTHENFFVAKNRDSDSAQRAFGRHGRVAMTPIACCLCKTRIKETAAAQSLPVTLTNADVGRC